MSQMSDSFLKEYIDEALARTQELKLICEICGSEEWFLTERCIDGGTVLVCDKCAAGIPPRFCPDSLLLLD